MNDLMTIDFCRVRNLFRMDWHRMVHGKAFYVMACIAAFMPIMMLTQMSDVRDVMMFVGSTSGESASFFGGGMNLSILTILSGMLLSIYVGKEYTSGHIKSIITVHANKCDYIIAKAVIAAIWNAIFIVIYLLTLFILGTVMGLPLGISSIGGLLLYVVEKFLLSIPMSILMICINLIFRQSYGWSILFVCVAGTGILVMSAKMGLQMLGMGALASILNFTITGASTFATLNSGFFAFIVICVVTVIWTLICTIVADWLMNKRDVL